ncbi:MAG: PAS domain-containing sensor histidine kinase [Beijerinckiaceae bacterium]
MLPEGGRGRRLAARLGPIIVLCAILSALASFFILAGLTPIPPTNDVLLSLFAADVIVVLALVGLVLTEAWALIRAWRRQAAASRLHIQIVGLFSIIAAAPALLMAVVGSITLDRTLNPAFMQDVRGFILTTAEAAKLFRETQCHSLLQEAQLTAADLDRGRTMYIADHAFFHEYFSSRAHFLGFTAAAMIRDDGVILEKVDLGSGVGSNIVQPEATDYEDAKKGEPLCLVLDEGRVFVAIRALNSFDRAFLYVSRPLDKFAMEFPRAAGNLIQLYDLFDSHRRNIKIAFAVMFGLLATIMLLSAVWLGLAFANRLVAPIRRLIAAADDVSSGNLDIRVPVNRSEGDLAHLGDTFNHMTSELKLQQNRLLAANQLIDERRQFTEAVLSGVPAAVIGVNPQGTISALNPSAEKLMSNFAEPSAIGMPVDKVMPELAAVLAEATSQHPKNVQSQLSLMRGGRERMFNVRVTSGHADRSGRSYVVTLDDITDLVSAQRTSAWADVARRIAHEIKNPLTPIQLSAERLKRKYGKVIMQDREIFDQCTDTIVRQVDDIKRMVDEFSSFARMPKAQLERDDLGQCVRQVLFLMRVGNPDIEIEEKLPEKPVIARFDRRLLSQALTNIVKNATEGVAAAKTEGQIERGHILVTLGVDSEQRAEIDVIDNGKGFPSENRQRLLEPYMTTRAEGTGLGLPIVAKILEDHGGGLELLDAPSGRGACVRLFLPLGRDIASADAAAVETEKA